MLVYEHYNRVSGAYRYTYRQSTQYGWVNRGVKWIAPDNGKPIYEIEARIPHYACSETEAQLYRSAGWRHNGLAFYSGEGEPIWTLLHPETKNKRLAVDIEEVDTLEKAGWINEGTWFKTL